MFNNEIQKYKDTMERPFMVYADWECSLCKTHEEGKTHRHKANSCGFYVYVPSMIQEINITSLKAMLARLK